MHRAIKKTQWKNHERCDCASSCQVREDNADTHSINDNLHTYINYTN